MGDNIFSSTASNTSSLMNANNAHVLHYDGPPMFSGMRCCAYYPAEVMASSAFTYTVMPMEYAMDVFQKFRSYNTNESEEGKDKVYTWKCFFDKYESKLFRLGLKTPFHRISFRDSSSKSGLDTTPRTCGNSIATAAESR